MGKRPLLLGYLSSRHLHWHQSKECTSFKFSWGTTLRLTNPSPSHQPRPAHMTVMVPFAQVIPVQLAHGSEPGTQLGRASFPLVRLALSASSTSAPGVAQLGRDSSGRALPGDVSAIWYSGAAGMPPHRPGFPGLTIKSALDALGKAGSSPACQVTRPQVIGGGCSLQIFAPKTKRLAATAFCKPFTGEHSRREPPIPRRTCQLVVVQGRQREA